MEEWKGRDVLKGRYRIFLFVETAAAAAAAITGRLGGENFIKKQFPKVFVRR